MTPATIAATGIAAGLSAGLAVLCWPRRLDPDPARRLEQLTASPSSAGDAAPRQPRLRYLRRLSHNPWTTARRNRRRDTEAARLAPVAADLLASCLASGTTPDRAAEAVASAIRPPGHVAGVADEAAFELACRFQDVAHRLRLGGNPISSWREVAAEPRLKRVADAMGRAGLTGTAPAAPVRACADDLRADHYAAGTAAARAAGVRATAPLAGCFLPAFVLIGVVPIVIGLADRLLP